jgi:isopenicillin N synthase-like dioxygenase
MNRRQKVTYAEANKIDFKKIPVIDISLLRNGENKDIVSEQLHQASKNLGFIYVKNHGIPENVIQNIRKDGLSFFRQDKTIKQEVKISTKHRGWLDFGGAKMNDNAKADLKESFIWGYQDRNGICSVDHPLRGKNLWPNSLPSLENNAMNFFNCADSLAKDLLKGFAIGLNLREDFFLKTSTNPLSRASLVYYPSQPPSMGKDQFGVSSHTDFGLLTVLCQDEVGGLQVQDINGEWFHAPPIPNTIIVNVADLLSRWTGGEYKSTPHRVVNKSNNERLSLVLAFDPDPETVIDPKEIFGNDYEANSEPITCGDYLIWRFGKAFSYRN